MEEVLLVVDTEAGVGPHQQVRLKEGSCKYIHSKIKHDLCLIIMGTLFSNMNSPSHEC